MRDIEVKSGQHTSVLTVREISGAGQGHCGTSRDRFKPLPPPPYLNQKSHRSLRRLRRGPHTKPTQVSLVPSSSPSRLYNSSNQSDGEIDHLILACTALDHSALRYKSLLEIRTTLRGIHSPISNAQEKIYLLSFFVQCVHTNLLSMLSEMDEGKRWRRSESQKEISSSDEFELIVEILFILLLDPFPYDLLSEKALEALFALISSIYSQISKIPSEKTASLNTDPQDNGGRSESSKGDWLKLIKPNPKNVHLKKKNAQ